MNPEQFNNWIVEFYKEPGPFRLGQAFINKLSDLGHERIVDPELFYSTDDAKSLKLIAEKYLNESGTDADV